jgi:galactokinase
LTIGTYAVARQRDDDRLRFYSLNFPEAGVIEASLDVKTSADKYAWGNYPLGVIWASAEKGIPIYRGLDMLIYGTIPHGSGLSSSASVEVLTGFALSNLFDIEVTLPELALIGQYAENHFCGVNCGIMDQFAIAMGRKDHAIFLNTATLDYSYTPLQLTDTKLVIASSNKKRGLADSKYNERRRECEEALADLQKVIAIDSLGDLLIEDFEKHKKSIRNKTCAKRAKHAVWENSRTVWAVGALCADNADKIDYFGQLMNESHISLRDDYEVTGIELDTLVEEAWKIKGVIGSRMTGAGFGGCTVSLVKNEAVEEFIATVGKAYQDKIGYAADFYVVEIGDGPRKI